MNDTVADFYFLILVHECLGYVGVMSVLDRRTSNERRPVRNCLLFGGSGKVLARRKDRRCSANRAHWRHKNVLRGNGNNRTR